MSEQQLRKALGAVNDLEPPRDDLFVDRAMTRGRARVHRRRSAVIGAAAGLALVGALGGTWIVGQQGQSETSSASAGSASAPKEASGGAADSATPQYRAPAAPALPPTLPPAHDQSGWFSGPVTPLRTAMESLAPTLETRFPDVFAGLYAADAGNTRIVLCVTRGDAALESLVRSSVPAGSAVSYRTVPHSIRVLRDAASRIDGARIDLQAQGVTVLGTQIDARTNRVVVTTLGPDHGAVGSLVGADLVTVVVDTSHVPGRMLPGGSTQAPLQR